MPETALAGRLRPAIPALVGAAFLAAVLAAGPAHAQTPSLPDLGTLPGMTAKEEEAHALWSLRAGLNVAALQCGFSKSLQTVGNYNAFLRQHSDELGGAMKTLNAYFVRTNGARGAPRAFDTYTTRTYQGFSTFDAQYAFCDQAAFLGRRALLVPKANAGPFAREQLPSFRQSLKETSRNSTLAALTISQMTLPDLSRGCRMRPGPSGLRC
jgi:hypothetical protein